MRKFFLDYFQYSWVNILQIYVYQRGVTKSAQITQKYNYAEYNLILLSKKFDRQMYTLAQPN